MPPVAAHELLDISDSNVRPWMHNVLCDHNPKTGQTPQPKVSLQLLFVPQGSLEPNLINRLSCLQFCLAILGRLWLVHNHSVRRCKVGRPPNNTDGSKSRKRWRFNQCHLGLNSSDKKTKMGTPRSGNLTHQRIVTPGMPHARVEGCTYGRHVHSTIWKNKPREMANRPSFPPRGGSPPLHGSPIVGAVESCRS